MREGREKEATGDISRFNYLVMCLGVHAEDKETQSTTKYPFQNLSAEQHRWIVTNIAGLLAFL
jgi:hypothetical protein